MSTNFGTDIAVVWTPTGPDLDLSRQATGNDVLMQSLFCRLTTKRGSVAFAPNDCIDIRQLVGAGIAYGDTTNLQQQIKNECLRDERVEFALVSAAYVQETKSLKITIQITSANGPFVMTLAVSNVSVTLINQSAT